VKRISPRTRATIDDLYRVPESGKAEIVNGEVVLMAPTGGIPGPSGGEIYVSLRD
jgi:Uma2 family endonuclease